jgi:hypothetical protein
MMMIQSFAQFPPADSITEEAASRDFGRQFRALRNCGRAADAKGSDLYADSRSPLDSDRFRMPQFLTSRIGLVWYQILAELRSITRNEAEYRRTYHVFAEFVETYVSGTSDEPKHGTGLLIGQPLTSGWRRRLYVCPASARLLRITSPGALKSGHLESV